MSKENVKQRNLVVLEQTLPIQELHTILRNKDTEDSEFVFCADRLIRIVIELGLNQLPYQKSTVITPTGYEYSGIEFHHGNIGVSVCRSGELMELSLRQLCRSIRIGKILISDEQELLYTRLVADINKRRVLLLYPVLSTGITVSNAIKHLLEMRVRQSNIYLITLFATQKCLNELLSRYPNITIVTSQICEKAPTFFTQKYFGTD
ncbi:Uracil phosphoribosyltransferase-like protein [Aphelenchoides besseyi]|nr:Uracil phosphoribosyltransferase-like protein [Aphelenchoides besseyi]KAI6218072.1 Uracil phosphoribosyltransferase-like protein [Aphelenchoides besseyi]